MGRVHPLAWDIPHLSWGGEQLSQDVGGTPLFVFERESSPSSCSHFDEVICFSDDSKIILKPALLYKISCLSLALIPEDTDDVANEPYEDATFITIEEILEWANVISAVWDQNGEMNPWPDAVLDEMSGRYEIEKREIDSKISDLQGLK
ncbi:hypothetical protein Fot_56411 [Forsythia ovata]|uniref:Uncharacterized protein n=1 Tax=Forsythia ovata TaxID=205694 RepID=A0ABD1P036_9LAMI